MIVSENQCSVQFSKRHDFKNIVSWASLDVPATTCSIAVPNPHSKDREMIVFVLVGLFLGLVHHYKHKWIVTIFLRKHGLIFQLKIEILKFLSIIYLISWCYCQIIMIKKKKHTCIHTYPYLIEKSYNF